MSASNRPIRVASVPSRHVYVRRLAHPGVDVVADPSGDDLRTPLLLDPDWLADHADAFDLLHVHFGFEFYGPARLEAVCDRLSDLGKPLVYTAHDLRNPNHPTAEVHDAGLDVWMARADAVITLTQWAATRIRARWHRDAIVLAHPHVVPLAELARRQARPRPQHPDAFRVGLHVKSLRANMVGAPALRAVLEGAAMVPGARVVVDMHCDVLDPASTNHDPELVALALEAARGPADLHVHNYYSDDELWNYLESVDAIVLPYRFGTHSGWLEAAKDLGTGVIAPSCGAYRDQGAQHVFTADEAGGLDTDSLACAVRDAAVAPRPAPVLAAERAVEREQVADAHARLYRQLVRRHGAVPA